MGMSMIKSDEYTENWLQRTWPGVVPSTIIICLIASIGVAANFIKYYRYKSASLKNKQILLGENSPSSREEAGNESR